VAPNPNGKTPWKDLRWDGREGKMKKAKRETSQLLASSVVILATFCVFLTKKRGHNLEPPSQALLTYMAYMEHEG
jgi:hypothetical protein